MSWWSRLKRYVGDSMLGMGNAKLGRVMRERLTRLDEMKAAGRLTQAEHDDMLGIGRLANPSPEEIGRYGELVNRMLLHGSDGVEEREFDGLTRQPAHPT